MKPNLPAVGNATVALEVAKLADAMGFGLSPSSAWSGCVAKFPVHVTLCPALISTQRGVTWKFQSICVAATKSVSAQPSTVVLDGELHEKHKAKAA